MAKKNLKPESAPPTQKMSEMADRLRDTSANAYEIAKSLGIPWNDDSFEQLRKDHKLFRCVECSTWKDTADEGLEDICNECTDSLD